jgi:hypothetical protein
MEVSFQDSVGDLVGTGGFVWCKFMDCRLQLLYSDFCWALNWGGVVQVVVDVAGVRQGWWWKECRLKLSSFGFI